MMMSIAWRDGRAFAPVRMLNLLSCEFHAGDMINSLRGAPII
jgi:hypothetical protein